MDYFSAIWYFLLMLAGLACGAPNAREKSNSWVSLGIVLILASLLRLWPLIWCGESPPAVFNQIELAILVGAAAMACLAAGSFSGHRAPYFLAIIVLFSGAWLGWEMEPTGSLLYARWLLWAPACLVLSYTILKVGIKHSGSSAVAVRLLVVGLVLMAFLNPVQEVFQAITKASSAQGNVIPLRDLLLWAILPTIALLAVLAGSWIHFCDCRMAGLSIDVRAARRERMLWFLFVIVLVAGWFWAAFSSRNADATGRAELVQEAKLVSSALDPALITQLTGTRSDENLPAYKTIKAQLADIVKASGSYRFAYLMAHRNGQVIFLVDNEPDGSKDESMAGDVYADAEPELLDAFQNPHPLVTGPYPDQWGIWITGYAPLPRLKMNNAPIYLGMDDNAKSWCANLDRIRLEKSLETLMLALFVVGLIVVNYLTSESSSRQAASEKRVRRSLQEAARLALVVEHTTDSVIIADTMGAMEWVNASFTKMTGYSMGEIQGKYLVDFLAEGETDAAAIKRIASAFSSRAGFKERLLRHHKSKRPYWVHIECQPLLGENGVLTGYMAIESDITASVVAEKKLLEAKDAADAANRAKSTFLATMSHEIRTPLNAVIGISSLLLETCQETHHRDYAATIASSGEILLELINDILDYSKIEAGRIEVENRPFTLADVLMETREILSPTAEEKKVGLTCDIEPSLPKVIVGDRMRLKQVLLNLVSNGIKFTENGSVTIRAERAGEAFFRITVKDTGIGISKEVQSRLFVPFMQADSSITRKYGGTGLGLAISKRLVELMRGTIAVQSTEGEGALFVVELPLQIADGSSLEVGHGMPTDFKPVSIQGRAQEIKTFKEIRVLVAEDNIMNQKVIRMLLSRLGITPVIVENGVQVLEAVKESPFDLLLIDIQMPVMDGLETTRRLIEFYKEEKRPDIVALTANAFKEDREACFAAGMDGYLVKPITLDRLRVVLEKVCGV